MLNKCSLDGWMDHAAEFTAAKGVIGFRLNVAASHRRGGLISAPPLKECTLQSCGCMEHFLELIA